MFNIKKNETSTNNDVMNDICYMLVAIADKLGINFNEEETAKETIEENTKEADIQPEMEEVKDNEVESTDKRKLIDEIGGILKGKVDDELWRTIIGKAEKIAYSGSETSEKDNACKNDAEEEQIKTGEDEIKEEVKKEEKKNSIVENAYRNSINGYSISNGYKTKAERIAEANKKYSIK